MHLSIGYRATRLYRGRPYIEHPRGRFVDLRVPSGYYVDYSPVGQQTHKLKDGIRLVYREGRWIYHAVAIAQFALGNYELFLRDNNRDNLERFLHQARWLVDNQKVLPGVGGGWQYEFPNQVAWNECPLAICAGPGPRNICVSKSAQRNIPFFLHLADVTVHLTGGLMGEGGMSHATLEAMAAGKPIVAWRNYTYSQFLEDGRTALLVEEKNVPELAKAIERLLDSEELREELGRSACQEAQKYNWEVVTTKLLEELSLSTQKGGKR